MLKKGFTNTALALTLAAGLSSGLAEAGEQTEIDQALANTSTQTISLLEECDANNDGAITGRENLCKIKRGIRLKKQKIASSEQKIASSEQKIVLYNQQNDTLREEIEEIKQEIRLKISKK